MEVNDLVINLSGLPGIVRRIKGSLVKVTFFTQKITVVKRTISLRLITAVEKRKLSYIDDYPNLLTVNQEKLVEYIRKDM